MKTKASEVKVKRKTVSGHIDTTSFVNSLEKENLSDEHYSTYYYLSSPVSHVTKACLIVIHDVYDYHQSYKFLEKVSPESELSKVSLAFYDLKGFGMSGGTRAHIEDFDIYCHQLYQLILILKKRHRKNHFIVMGSGLGGLVALRFHQLFREHSNFPIEGFILINPLLGFNEKKSGFLSYFYQALDSPLSHLKWLTSFDLEKLIFNSREREQLKADSLATHLISIGLYNEINRVVKEVRDGSYFVDRPCLFLVSDKDHLTRTELTNLYCKGLSKELASMKRFPHSYHDLFHGPHSPEVVLEVFNWLKLNFLK